MAVDCNVRLIALIVGMCSLYVAATFIIVGLTTNFWLEYRTQSVSSEEVKAHFGLHRVCYTENDHCSNPNLDYDDKDSLPAVRALVCIGAFLAVIACGLSLVNLAFDRIGVTKLKITIASIVASVLTGIFIISGCGLFASKVDVDPDLIRYSDNIYKGYSFGLTTTAGCLSWVSGLLFVLSAFYEAEPKFDMQ